MPPVILQAPRPGLSASLQRSATVHAFGSSARPTHRPVIAATTASRAAFQLQYMARQLPRHHILSMLNC